MEYEPEGIDWTEEDEKAVNKIKDNATWMFKYFLIGMACGVGVFIILKIIDWWIVSDLTGVFLR